MDVTKTQAEEQDSFRKVEKWSSGNIELVIHRFEGLPPYYFIHYTAKQEFTPAARIVLEDATKNTVKIVFDVEEKVHFQDSPTLRNAIKEMEDFCRACEEAGVFQILME